MRIKDEAMFMQKSGGAGPVMDGLVFWLDFDDELNASDYVDEVHFLQMNIKERISGNSVFVDSTGGWKPWFRKFEHGIGNDTAGTSGWFKCSYDGVFPYAKTVEVVSSAYTSNFSYNSEYRLAGTRLTATSFFAEISSSTSEDTLTFPHTDKVKQLVAVCAVDPYNYMYMNSELVKTAFRGDRENIRITASNFFSSDGGSGNPRFNLMSIRVYDRALTPEEILHNYNYEKSLGRVE